MVTSKSWWQFWYICKVDVVIMASGWGKATVVGALGQSKSAMKKCQRAGSE